jgi:type III restriction enzyme
MAVSKGYVFGTKLKTTAIEGIARTTHDMMKLNTIFGGEHQINNHDDGFIIRDAKRRIARAIGVDENISNNALRILFGPEDMQMSVLSQEERDFEHEHKLLTDMNLREYNAFLVNNRDKLIEVFSTISETEIGEIKETDVIVSDWGIPPYQYYKQHKKIAPTAIMSKNVFDNYGNNILIAPNRTVSEVEFERWCENYDAVKHIYKNGDKGDEYFSVIYRKAFRRSNFYPDYIIQLENGDVWVIEAKGGMTADGSSNNIDGYAEKKFEALKTYAERVGGFKWGFVRAVGTQLYLSNTVWAEDVTNRNVWKQIEEYI